ncbi:hypothetical protein Lepto7375DRAFT_7297 [Leptolyngbya sp. PCC 7375]|nr:hypothetical protein Lepto7375DRAFT_7297 [Leptolyngbya sp. PCC 7375]
MPTIIDYPVTKQTSVLSTLRFVLLPVGTRTPTSYTVVADADQTPVTGIVVDTGSPVSVGDTTVTLATAVTLPNRAKVTFANGMSVRLTSAAAASTTLAVEPVKRNPNSSTDVSIPADTAGTYNHGLITLGAEYLSVEALPVSIFPGEELFFDVGGANTKVTVATYAPAGAVVLEILPLTAALTDGDTAATFATAAIAGATDASPSSAPKIVDATNFTSGAGYEGLTTGTNRTLNFTFQNILGDPGSDTLKQILYNDLAYNREIYAILKRDAGDRQQAETYEGACIATQGDQASPVQDLINITANLQFQGASFRYTPTDGAFDIFNPASYVPPGLAV